MERATLHYLYDPLCGWCYGAAPLVKAARSVLPVIAHAGGMMAGAQREPVTPELRAYVMPHDRRIAQLTGQPFGDAYFNGLLRETSAVFDSAPPIAAILTAEKIAGRGLDLLSRLQTAHYVEGRRIADRAVLIELAGSLSLDPTVFGQTFDSVAREETQPHIVETRLLMSRLGAQGFPSFALERDGRMTLLNASAFLGRPGAFVSWLKEEAGGQGSAKSDFQCGPEGCAL